MFFCVGKNFVEIFETGPGALPHALENVVILKGNLQTAQRRIAENKIYREGKCEHQIQILVSSKSAHKGAWLFVGGLRHNVISSSFYLE